MKKSILLSLAASIALGAGAQSWHEGDIQWIESTAFADNVAKWATDHKLGDDDNFFISRVRPKLRFRNTATQVREDLKFQVNDRRLVAWIPFNVHDGGESTKDSRDALPSGIFDSEVFTMWSYVDHWGDWTAPLGQIPAGLSDVAHKNGVAVSSVGSIPYGAITTSWSTALRKMATTLSTEDGAMNAAKMLKYYGHDGIGYNSEFSGFSNINLAKLRTFHEYLLKNLKTLYSADVPGYDMQENMWYDGTNDNGSITFDNGLGSHNYQTWGPKGNERSSLFLNYNWVSSGTSESRREANLIKSIQNAASDTYGKGRNPLYLYCGLNMQGGEPGATRTPWVSFAKYNMSIGLWGQHKVNLFFEGRGSRGTTPDAQQATYQYRIENWFTGGTHNPANCPTTLSNLVTCSTDDTDFHGMSTFMSARSTLSWDLSNEAFISYFNTGNGKFFNWKGQRMNDNQWYNIGVQDFMPTWRWWWTNKFLGKTAEDVPAAGLSSVISWNDAYVGGSTIRITGSTTDANYLHLFKTGYELQAGDVITFVYKLAGGSTNADLVMSVNGSEATVAKSVNLCTTSVLSDDSEWITKTYTVASGDGLAGKTLAVIGLKFDNATNLDMYLGEVSIKRGTLAAPVQPEITKVNILRSHYAGVDAKVIFNVPNNKPAGEVCYNDEVNTSLFKIWAKEEGKEPVLLGITTSWAAMCYSVPFEGDENGNGNIAFGVQPISLDHQTEGDIVWSENVNSGTRSYSDQIQVDKTTITPGESFTLSTVDEKRSFAWEIWTAGDNSVKVAESGTSTNAWECEGLEEMTTYNVKCIGANNTAADHVMFNNFLVVTNPSAGRLPEIESLTANGSTTTIDIVEGETVTLEYTGRDANGIASRGIQLDEKFFGIQAKEIMDGQYESFSIAGWLKITYLPGDCVWIDVRRYDGSIWPRNNWGWLWTNIKQDGTLMDFHHDITNNDGPGAIQNPLVYDFGNGKTTFFNPGQWTHFAFTFERSTSQCRSIIYINGKKIESKWFYYTYTGDDYIADPYNTSRSPSQTGTTDDYVKASKSLHLDSYISIGGTRHTGRGGGLGFKGVLDDFQVWDHAMTQEEVNASMAGLDGNNLPEGVLAFFDFESNPGDDNMFVAKGKKAGVKGGYYSLASGTTEGEGLVTYESPLFISGCPFIPGVDYKIETTPSWNINKSTLSEIVGNDKEGSVKATFPVAGDYTATLTLSNDLGSDKKEFQFIKVGDPAGIDDIVADGGEMRTYTIDDVLYLEVVNNGFYNVDIYGVNGQLVASKAQNVAAGDFMRIALNGAPGVYVVNVACDGNKVKAFKVVKK